MCQGLPAQQAYPASGIKMHDIKVLLCLAYFILQQKQILKYLCNLARVLNFYFAVF
jgi:hypothetical protein